MNELAAVKVIKTDEQHAQPVADLFRLMEATDSSASGGVVFAI